MKKIKTLFISKIKKITKDKIYDFSKLPYTKVVLFYLWVKEITNIKLSSNVEVIRCITLTDINKQINKLFEKYPDYTILPDFAWDDYSKYSIKTYNKTYKTKVWAKIFKEKDQMVEFLWDIAAKKYVRFSHKELITKNYNDFSEIMWKSFIVKPTNASSSTNTFKIKNQEEFEDIKWKLAKSYDYIIEEYIWWNLFSIDFFFDGEKIFLLVLAREVVMIELSDKNKFSNKFIEKYWEELTRHFNFILPLSYHIDFSKLSTVELWFIEKIRLKLVEIWYKWVIHLEYKYDSKIKKIWFLEWGARYGWYRKIFMKKIYHTDYLRLPYYLLINNDYSKFSKVKWNIYKFKEKEYNLNFVRVKTNFIDTTNYIEILKKSWDVFKNSFNGFLKDYYKNKFWIDIKNVKFFVKYDKNNNFFPFYRNNNTSFDYILELNDENFSIFKKKKFKIIEGVFFHDYNK